MSAFHPEDVDLNKLPVTIMGDRECVQCGYNLKGIKSDAKCPECGRAIARPRIKQFAQNMVAAPLPWLEFFAWGAFFCMVAAFAFGFLFLSVIGAVLLNSDISSPVAAAMLCGVALVWWVGVFIVTRPRPIMPGSTVNPTIEWAGLRWASRVTQAFWFVAGACALAAAIIEMRGAVPPTSLGWLAIGAFFIAAAGTIPLCILASNLAFWASDSALAYGLRTESWMIGWAVFLYGAFLVEVRLLGFVTGGIFSFAMALLWLFSILAPVLWGAACVWRFNSMAKWAVLNHVTAEGREMRLRDEARPALERERAERERLRREAAARPAKAKPKPASPPPAQNPASPAPAPEPSDRTLNPYDVE